MLLQAHWQHRLDGRTEFVAQNEFTDVTDVMSKVEAWLKDVFERHKDSRPGEDWTPMVCTEDAPCFVKAVAPC